MPYATAQDMLDRIDSRWLCQLVNDDNTPATTLQFIASTRVAAALSDAAGKILASALQGKRYTKDSLLTLQDDGLSLLVWLNVQLAAGNLANARQIPVKDMADTLPAYGEALAFLQQLQMGNVIFDINPDTVNPNAQAGLPATQRQSSVIVRQARPYFGDLGECWPRNWGNL